MKTAELPPRCAKTRKATSWFGLVWVFFLTQLVIQEELHEDECEGLSRTSYLVLLCGTTELNVISWAEGNRGIAEVLNSH